MREFKFYHNGIKEAKATTLALALIEISKAFKEFEKLTPKQLIKEIKIIEL